MGSQGTARTVRSEVYPAVTSTGPGRRRPVRHATTREGGAPVMSDTTTITDHSAPPVPGVERPRLVPPPAWPAATGRLYMTSDLRAATGLPRTHMDFYLREGLIVPTTRSESGYLLFDDAELATLCAIVADRAAGIPLREIRQRLGR